MASAQDPAKCLCCRRSSGRTMILVLFMVMYLLFGAFVFSLIESPGEQEIVRELKLQRRNFMFAHNKCMEDSELEDMIVKVVRASKRGISAIGNVSGEPNWSFGQSIFFSATVLTTIGYGHTTPLSDGGKAFCIIFAVIGIPLTLIVFTALVERLMLPSTKLLQFLFSKAQDRVSAYSARLVHISAIGVIIVLLVFIIPSFVFSYLEKKWNFLDALYYCVISMSTIGLGDYIPGESRTQENRALYKTMTTFYLYCGLILMMFLLAVLYEIPELNLGLHFYMDSDTSNEDEEKQQLRDGGSNDKNYTDEAAANTTDKEQLVPDQPAM